jgi:hypothetical protein
MQATPTPAIATGKVFDAYLTAARTNLDNMLKLATALGDKEFALAAQHAIDGFECGAETALELIAEANAPMVLA